MFPGTARRSRGRGAAGAEPDYLKHPTGGAVRFDPGVRTASELVGAGPAPAPAADGVGPAGGAGDGTAGATD